MNYKENLINLVKEFLIGNYKPTKEKAYYFGKNKIDTIICPRYLNRESLLEINELFKNKFYPYSNFKRIIKISRGLIKYNNSKQRMLLNEGVYVIYKFENEDIIKSIKICTDLKTLQKHSNEYKITQIAPSIKILKQDLETKLKIYLSEIFD
jgi:hypothetical protein